MKRTDVRIAGALVALAAIAWMAGAVRAEGLEAAAVKAESLGSVWDSVRETIGSVVAKIPGVPSRGTWGKDHCSPYDDSMVPVNNGRGDGENGYYCVSRKPASVTCQIIGYEQVTDDSGVWLKPVLGECIPKGGFAGDGSSLPGRDAPQSP